MNKYKKHSIEQKLKEEQKQNNNRSKTNKTIIEND